MVVKELVPVFVEHREKHSRKFIDEKYLEDFSSSPYYTEDNNIVDVQTHKKNFRR